MKFDAVVLGGGMVGVSTGIHLLKRGRSVAIVDRKAPGNETSLGNAGLIQREGVYPYAFPRDAASLMRYAKNRSPDVRYHRNAIGRNAPFLAKYWYHSEPGRHAAIARSYATLIAHCVTEHRSLSAAADADHLIRQGGWIKVFRRPAVQDAELRAVERWQHEYGVTYEALDAAALRALEPSLSQVLLGGVRYTGSETVRDPKALLDAYLAYFKTLGGVVIVGDAASLTHRSPRWELTTTEGAVQADAIVVALGPWSSTLVARFGYTIPFGLKRGYHMHYAPQTGAQLQHPVLDAENGYMLAPMLRGIRLTTGVELARDDAPSTPLQVELTERSAREMFPLGERLDPTPWLGRRPCTPDMMPIIGPTQHEGLWFAFGHAHHGLTLGPVTGRLIAEMMTGQTPFVDPAPFHVRRFTR
ncbi:FAD-binding oxidoreductase [Robbsia sp. KACC 23696]|uniref:NAD(P)/FAD-dependent oxidoreductase n=1 Tax=Robbsia sp. KACC 23696 TaxID=3149231 RepID=UPI00325BBE29